MHSIEHLSSRLPSLCERLGVLYVDMFGSFARGEAEARSDLDLVIEFDMTCGGAISRRFFTFIREVEELFEGPVDVLTEGSIKNPILRRNIDKERIRIYG